MAKRGSNLLPPTGQRNQTGRMLSSNRVKRGVRGELLTNGFKSLRDQGMLRANKLGAGGVANDLPVDESGKAKEIEHVNICIEKKSSQRSPDKINADVPLRGANLRKDKKYSKLRDSANKPFKHAVVQEPQKPETVIVERESIDNSANSLVVKEGIPGDVKNSSIVTSATLPQVENSGHIKTEFNDINIQDHLKENGTTEQ